ncbi:hypothetical protein [Streptomyces sp. SP18BB07]|uniref:hypothetical protein n=1 Tax=Streptomyces sp. SP18BB07 TaxID=3002522 RepID=UPI002E79512F|nr:hypothetical protein [Streptomyces sp. SP18BB07]MEE1762376.1 hypothetical protein [Streptomyces sp. SP18BB07]
MASAGALRHHRERRGRRPGEVSLGLQRGRGEDLAHARGVHDGVAHDLVVGGELAEVGAEGPVMDAIDLLGRYLEQPLKEGAFFDPAETVPLDGVVPEQWRAAVVDDKGRVERIPYELCVLVALRDALRRREIWVVGANRWRNPEDDLPADFEDNRDVHYAALGQPQDASEFITALQGRLRTSLDRFDRVHLPVVPDTLIRWAVPMGPPNTVCGLLRYLRRLRVLSAGGGVDLFFVSRARTGTARVVRQGRGGGRAPTAARRLTSVGYYVTAYRMPFRLLT